AAHYGLADDVVVKSDDLAVLVETRLDGMDIGWPVAPTAHVVLAGPLHLYRLAGAERARRSNCFDDQVGIRDRAAAKAAACLHHMQPHLIRRCPADLRGGGLIDIRHLMSAPDIDGAVLIDAGDRVEWFDRRMGEIGE